MGGRKYVKEEELTRAVLLEWAKRQGAIKEVNLISKQFRVWEAQRQR
jgi:hypothetical protein